MRTLSINTDPDKASSFVVINSATVYVLLISSVTASQDFVDHVCVVLPSGAVRVVSSNGYIIHFTMMVVL